MANRFAEGWYANYLSHNSSLDLLWTHRQSGNWDYGGVGYKGLTGASLTKFGSDLWVTTNPFMLWPRSGPSHVSVSRSSDGRIWAGVKSFDLVSSRTPVLVAGGQSLNLFSVETGLGGNQGDIVHWRCDLAGNWSREVLGVRAYECAATFAAGALQVYYVSPADNLIWAKVYREGQGWSNPVNFMSISASTPDNVVLSASAYQNKGFVSIWLRDNRSVWMRNIDFSTDGGVSHGDAYPLGSSSGYLYTPSSPCCFLPPRGKPYLWAGTPDGAQTLEFTELTGNAQDSSSATQPVYNQALNGTPGAVYISYTQGTVRPRYHINTLIYAPPGSRNDSPDLPPSSVTYSDGSTTGTTNSVTKSFTQGVTASASVSFPAESGSLSAEWSKSTTESSTDSVAINKSRGDSISQDGSREHDGIDHSSDKFVLWLNPKLTGYTDNLGNVEWEVGVDGEIMKIIDVTVAELQNPSLMTSSKKNALDVAGLTAEDYEEILSTNGFLNTDRPIDLDRYIPCNKTIDYTNDRDRHGHGISGTQTGTISTSQLSQRVLSNSTAVSYSVKAETSGFVSTSVGVNFSWTNTNESGSSEETTQTATYSISPPSPEWGGSAMIYVYWDRIFQTFAFSLEELGA